MTKSGAVCRILLLLASAFAPVFGSTLDVRLRFEANEALPHVPLSFAVTVTNSGTKAATLANELRIRDTTDSGTYMALWGYSGREYGELTTEPAALTLEPGTSRTYRFAVDRLLAEPQVYFDARMSRTGAHELEAAIRAEQSFAYVFSSVEKVRHEVRTESDLKVLQYMESHPGVKSGWDNREWISLASYVAQFAWREQPSSAYLEYVALFVVPPDPSNRFSVMEQLAQSEAKTSFHDDLLMILGDFYADIARQNLGTDELRARDFSRRALMKFETVAKHSNDEGLRAVALRRARDQADWYARAVRTE